MRLCDVFIKANIVWEIESSRKEDVVAELVRRMVASKAVPQAQAVGVERAVMRREELGSTGIGKGVAVPHAKHAGVKGVAGAFGRCGAGLDFNALDGQPVYLIFLLVSAPDAVEAHLDILRQVTGLLKDDDFRAFLRRARSQNEMADLLREADERLK